MGANLEQLPHPILLKFNTKELKYAETTKMLNKKLFWFIGAILDGYYIKKGIVYKQTFREFLGNVIHYFKNYRSSRKLS